MKRGLYAFAGASATATAAACAKRLEAPMTNVSKRYFGFSRAVGSPGPVAGAGCAASGPGAPVVVGALCVVGGALHGLRTVVLGGLVVRVLGRRGVRVLGSVRVLRAVGVLGPVRVL